MYSTVPPRRDDPREPDVGWGVRRAVRLAFPDPASLTRDEAHTARLDVYLTDLLQPYGLALKPGALEPDGQSYGEMAEALIELAVPAAEGVDLLVLAYAIPDIAPGRATTTYLSHVCPGGPMAFAISDQGTAAAFTGLRLIREYARSGGLRQPAPGGPRLGAGGRRPRLGLLVPGGDGRRPPGARPRHGTGLRTGPGRPAAAVRRGLPHPGPGPGRARRLGLHRGRRRDRGDGGRQPARLRARQPAAPRAGRRLGLRHSDHDPRRAGQHPAGDRADRVPPAGPPRRRGRHRARRERGRGAGRGQHLRQPHPGGPR